jgi:hypothetical protein
VALNIDIRDQRIVACQYKDPFGFLERSPEGAFKHSWWAILDALRAAYMVAGMTALRAG